MTVVEGSDCSVSNSELTASVLVSDIPKHGSITAFWLAPGYVGHQAAPGSKGHDLLCQNQDLAYLRRTLTNGMIWAYFTAL